jgi:uncharacterized membrane protein
MKLSSLQKKQIVTAIRHAENKTSGEIRVHLSYSKNEEVSVSHAQAQFEKLKMHLTKDRNGILLYINPVMRKFALYGDVGIHTKLSPDYWENLKNSLRTKIQETNLVSGIMLAVEELGHQLKDHFPFEKQDQNELKDDVSESE